MRLALPQGLIWAPIMTEAHTASLLAHHYHAGQFDKSGHPYVSHPAGVVGILVTTERYRALSRRRRSIAKAAGWLHDVIEDCDATAGDLVRQGVSAATVHVVMLLTHHPNEPRADYLRRVSRSRVATAVKFADLTHNSLPDRLRLLDAPTRDRLIIKYGNDFALLEELERAANAR